MFIVDKYILQTCEMINLNMALVLSSKYKYPVGPDNIDISIWWIKFAHELPYRILIVYVEKMIATGIYYLPFNGWYNDMIKHQYVAADIKSTPCVQFNWPLK